MLSRVIYRNVTLLRARCTARFEMAARRPPPQMSQPQPVRFARAFASQGKSAVDEKIEEIQEQSAPPELLVEMQGALTNIRYATAKDEFEIAMEETESNTVYAQDDRDAARDEFDKLKDMFNTAIADAENGEEIQKRIGQRIRELESAVENMEELAQNQD